MGYGASSLGVKLDVDNAGARFLVTLFFYVLHQVRYFTVARGLVKLNMHYTWQHELSSALLNAVLAAVLVCRAGSVQAENVRAVVGVGRWSLTRILYDLGHIPAVMSLRHRRFTMKLTFRLLKQSSNQPKQRQRRDDQLTND